MKKIISSLFVLILTMGLLAGCGKKVVENADKTQKNSAAVNSQLEKFKEKEGLLTYTDKSNSPFENSGLEITIKKGESGYAKFVKTDKEGKATVDYYTFDYGKNTVEKYYYVSAMGTDFYYYYDLAKGELAKIEDGKHNDNTQKTKEANRWDKAAATMQEEVKALEKYFKEQYNKTIKEAVIGK